METVSSIPTASRVKQGMRAVQIGLSANVLLAILKTVIGISGHSPALLADGINSTSDVAYYVVISIFMRLAGKPPDDQHPYGHNQMESIGALVVGSFVVTTAIAIFWDSVNKVYELLSGFGDFTGASVWALWVAIFTVVLKIGLTYWTRGIGRSTNNPAVLALAHDHRNDTWAAVAASLGIFLGRMGFLWVDPLAGALVAFVILSTGIEILRESTTDLMDAVPGKALQKQITALLTPIEAIKNIDEILSHRFGPYLVVILTICVDGNLTVAQGDAIADQVESVLLAEVDLLRRVHVHYHPTSGHSHSQQGGAA